MPKANERAPRHDFEWGRSHEHVYTRDVGWAVFDTGDGLQIQRIDEFFADVFDDEDAEWLVLFLAVSGDRAAREALQVLDQGPV